MQLQTLKELEDSIGGRPKFQLRQKKVRLSFYLGMRKCEYLKAYATANELSISEIVRGQLKPLLNKPVLLSFKTIFHADSVESAYK